MATEVVFTNADFAGQGTANTGSEVTATKDGVTFTFSKGYSADESLRCYAHGALTISAESTIEKINFTTTGGKTGGLDAEVTVGATTYSVADLASQARFTEIKVTLAGEAPAVATPVISGDETFTESVIVTITCSTPEADIYYTTDGTTDPKCDCPAAPEYTQQIVLTETTTIMAAAYTGNDWSAVATKTFTKVEPLPEPTDCATAAAAALSVSANNELYNDGAVYTIQGYVTSIKTAYSDQYHNISFWMADTQEGGEVLQAYRAACETEADAPAVGDKVAVTGSLTKYGTTPEFAAGCTFEIIGDDPVVQHTYTVAGNLADLFGTSWDPSNTTNDMDPVLGGDLYVWRKDSVNLTAGNIEFKVCEDHGWDKAYPTQNYILNIAEAGYYDILIRFNPKAEEPDSMIIAGATKVGDAPQPADVWDEIVFTEVTAAGVFNDSIFTVEGSEFSLKCVDTDNSKLKTTSNNASFGSLDERHDYTIRLQTSGKSGSKNNMELNIPADGKLRIAVRTGSSSDLTRTLVLAQGNDTICNKILLDTDTVPGASSPKIFNFIYVDVKAGKVAVTYPVNAINFYSFAFKANEPEPEVIWTVAGSKSVFGSEWSASDANNDMVKQEDGTYKWEKENITLAAGNVEFKVVKDHSWAEGYPAQNYQLAISEAGIYTITITFNAETQEVAAVATKTGEAVVDPTVSIAGSMNGWNVSADMMTLAEDKATASLTLNLAAQTYEFKVVLNGGDWRSNGQDFTRENASAAEMTGNLDNMHLVADVAGDYIFTWTFADNSLAITYPEAPVVGDTIVIDIESEVQYTDYVAQAGWWQFMAENDEYEISISNGYTTQAAGTYTIADLDADYTYLLRLADSTEISFVAGSFVLTEGEDGSRTIEGVVTGDDEKIYSIKLVFRIPTAETTVNVEIPNWGVADAAEIYSYTGTLFYGEAADGTYIQFVVLGDNPIGTFTYDDMLPNATGIEVGGKFKAIYSMDVTVNASDVQRAIITMDILCYNNTLYHVTTHIGEGINAVEAAQKAVKMIQNGQVVIIKNGVHYNINGAVIR